MFESHKQPSPAEASVPTKKHTVTACVTVRWKTRLQLRKKKTEGREET
jgi:hypothetical protein